MIKLLSTLALLIIFPLSMQGQIIKMRTEKVCHKIGNENWSNWEKFETLVVVNGDKKNITIFGEPKEVFEIISKNETNTNSKKIVSFNCVDIQGEECMVEIMNNKELDSLFLVITYDNAVMMIKLNPA